MPSVRDGRSPYTKTNKYIVDQFKVRDMKNWQIIGVLTFLIIGTILMSGCTNTGSASTAPVATPTPQVVYVTVTPTPTPVSKTVLFTDDLSQWRSEWDSETADDSGKTFYSGGSLHILNNNKEFAKYHELNKNFNDFILDVDIKMVDGSINNWQGVVVRQNGLAGNHYDFDISADGYYEILKWENHSRYPLVGSTPPSSSYINTGIGATNHIRVEANKNTLSFSVNGHPLKTVTDNTFNEGTVALKADCIQSAFTEVAYNNLVITQI